MSEGLEPHHHIIRRAGSTLNKHLNLSDEALITRLIDRGCIGADDRGRYTGKTKRVKDRFIARFQNQSYELFLSFVECLREDEKYSQLVAVLDDALAEYGHVIPSDVTTTTRDASPTPIESVETTTQQDDNPLIPSSTDLPTLPPVPTPVVTETDTKPSVVMETDTEPPIVMETDTEPPIVMETDTKLPVGMETNAEPPVVMETEPPVIMETDTDITPTTNINKTTTQQDDDDPLTTIPSSPMLPSPPVIMETDTNTTPTAKVNKQRLPRQLAVTNDDDDEVPPIQMTMVDDNVENVSNSLTKLSIATKGGDYPRLPFVGDRETMTFTSEGGELFSFVHNFRIEVPPNAVPPGCHATLHIRGCCHGPFQLPQGCRACSDFIFVEMEGIDSFQLPVLVELSHNLVMEDYVKCHEVMICRCNYDNSLIARPSQHQFPLVFSKIDEPNVSDKMNIFSLRMKTFCGLCAAYESSPFYPYLKSKPASLDDHQLRRSHSGSTDTAPVKIPSTDEQHDSFERCDSFESGRNKGSSQSRKRRLAEYRSAGSAEKQSCHPEYTFLCYWPLSLQSGALSVVMFVSKNCPTSVAACKQQVEKMSNQSQSTQSLLYHSFDFIFDESKRLVVEVDSPALGGWKVNKRSPACAVHESDILDNSHEDDFDHAMWLKKKVDDMLYPPRIILDIYYHKYQAIIEHCDITLQVTGLRGCHDRDTSLNIHVHSDMFSEQTRVISSFDDVIVDLPPHDITNSVLVQIALKISRLRQVAEELGYDRNDINKLHEEYDTNNERCYQALLQWWQCPPHNSSTKLEQLYRSLCKTGQSDCLQKVFTEDDNYKSITFLSSKSEIAEGILSSDINGDQSLLVDIACYLSGKWRIVGRLLDLEEYEVDEVFCDYGNSKERAYRMLDKWRQKKGSTAKVSQLVAALLIVKQHDALKVIKKITKME